MPKGISKADEVQAKCPRCGKIHTTPYLVRRSTLATADVSAWAGRGMPRMMCVACKQYLACPDLWKQRRGHKEDVYADSFH